MKKILIGILSFMIIFTAVGCTKKAEVNITAKDIVGSIEKKIIEDMKENGVPEDSLKDGKIPGYMKIDLKAEEVDPMGKSFTEILNLDDIEEGIVLQSMFNVNSDLLIVLKANDEAKVESIKNSLQKIKEKQEEIWSTYLPNQYEKVKNNIIKSEGKYLIYITNEKPEIIEDVFDNELNK